MQDDIHGVWVPTARVQHYICSERLKLSFAWNFYAGCGRSKTRIDGPMEGSLFLGAPRWLYTMYWQYLVRSYWRRITGKSNWLPCYLEAAVIQGQIRENRALRRQRRDSRCEESRVDARTLL